MQWQPMEDGRWSRLPFFALLLGLAAFALCAIGAFFDPGQFFRSYLLAFLFWLGIALGSLTIVMIHSLTGGRWGVVIRRSLESGTRTMPLMALLFVPVALGSPHIYSWMREHGNPAQTAHELYLSSGFFFSRAAFYFLCWLILVYLLNRWAREHDVSADAQLTRRIRILSGPGLVLYVLTATFASVDWVMSLDAHWHSTIYGILFMGGQVLSAFAFAIVMAALLSRHKPLSDVMRPDHFQDLGNLLLAFVMLWAYFAFSQYLIIWSGNLPAHISWYVRRLSGGWEWVGVFLVVFHFFVPFVLLLSRATKRRVFYLSCVAVGILFMRWVDLLWFTAPAFHPEAFFIHWMDVMASLGMGGIWLAFYLFQLRRSPLLPLHDPYVLGELRDGRA